MPQDGQSTGPAQQPFECIDLDCVRTYILPTKSNRVLCANPPLTFTLHPLSTFPTSNPLSILVRFHRSAKKHAPLPKRKYSHKHNACHLQETYFPQKHHACHLQSAFLSNITRAMRHSFPTCPSLTRAPSPRRVSPNITRTLPQQSLRATSLHLPSHERQKRLDT